VNAEKFGSLDSAEVSFEEEVRPAHAVVRRCRKESRAFSNVLTKCHAHFF
jgi:hypothetical protein